VNRSSKHVGIVIVDTEYKVLIPRLKRF